MVMTVVTWNVPPKKNTHALRVHTHTSFYFTGNEDIYMMSWQILRGNFVNHGNHSAYITQMKLLNIYLKVEIKLRV